MKQIAVIFISIFGLVLIFNLVRELISYPQAYQRLKQTQERVAQLKLKNWQLQQEKQYRESKDFLEKEIRNKLMMGKKDEIMVVLPEEVRQKIASESINKVEKEEVPVWRQWWELFR